MNTIQRVMLLTALGWLAVTAAYGQGAGPRSMTVPFDNPGRPGLLIIASGEGDVVISGYSGKEVRIKASVKAGKDSAREEDPKAKGLKRVAGSGFLVTTSREENAIVITRSMDERVDLEIQVPFNSVLKVGKKTGGNDMASSIANSVISSMTGYQGGIFEGDITVDGISGEMELSTLGGDITLKNLSGGVVANSLDGDVTAAFRSVPGNRPLAFSSVDGDIDVTLPANARVTITAKNVDGSIYTDFELETGSPEVQRDTKDSSMLGGILAGAGGNSVSGRINGGGTSVQLRTVDGNIYIRKAK